jgi:hypothetical protein
MKEFPDNPKNLRTQPQTLSEMHYRLTAPIVGVICR